MQLQMTAPLDIGLEQTDPTLRGQDDIFDLDEASKGLRKKGGISALGDEDDADSSEEEAQDEEDEDEALDSEEERERKVGELEAELDGLYDAYQERMREKDAKYMVKEARKKSKDREEWAGIREKDSEDEDSDDEEGGYDVVQRAKARAGEDSDSESDDSDAESDSGFETAARSAKRPRIDDSSLKQRKKARTDPASAPSTSTGPLTRTAQVWFSQGLFEGAGIDDVEDDDDEESDADEDEMDVDADSGLDMEEASSQDVSWCQPHSLRAVSEICAGLVRQRGRL